MPKTLLLLTASLLLGLFSLLGYYCNGYMPIIFVAWLAAIVLCGLYFYFREKEKIKTVKTFDTQDWLIAIILFLIFSPLYLFFSFEIPFQIGSDEVFFVSAAKRFIHQPIDLFGVSSYFGFPNFIFILWGWLSQLMGGINLMHVRLINGFFGLIIISLSYLFFRILFLSKVHAVGGAMIMGSQHVLLALSRMAMWNNTPLLIALTALTLLYVGWKYHSFFYTYWGGAATGLSFYVYTPARIIVILWTLFLVVSSVVLWSKQQRRVALQLSCVGAMAFLFVIAPMIISTIHAPPSLFAYQRQQVMVFPEARELQKTLLGAQTINEALKKNISNGLLAFNKSIPDGGATYLNYRYGFIDPLSQILLWLGIIIVLTNVIIRNKSEKKEPNLLMLSGFLFLWLFFTFFVTRNPNYTRLLIIVPFIVYLVLMAVQETITFFLIFLRKIFKENKKFLLTKISFYLFWLIIISITMWNLVIYKDYIVAGIQYGHELRGVGRYVEAKKNLPHYAFLLAADNEYSTFYTWGSPDGWTELVKFFAADNQAVQIINPQDLFSMGKVMAICSRQYFTLFLPQTLYYRIKDNLLAVCRPYRIHNIKPDGSILALEFLQ